MLSCKREADSSLQKHFNASSYQGLKALSWGLIGLVGVELMLSLDSRPSSGQQRSHTCAWPSGALVTAGRGEMRPLWRGQQGPCPGH